jgi:hypothetical protein
MTGEGPRAPRVGSNLTSLSGQNGQKTSPPPSASNLTNLVCGELAPPPDSPLRRLETHPGPLHPPVQAALGFASALPAGGLAADARGEWGSICGAKIYSFLAPHIEPHSPPLFRQEGSLPMHAAALNGHTAVVQLLAEAAGGREHLGAPDAVRAGAGAGAGACHNGRRDWRTGFDVRSQKRKNLTHQQIVEVSHGRRDWRGLQGPAAALRGGLPGRLSKARVLVLRTLQGNQRPSTTRPWP